MQPPEVGEVFEAREAGGGGPRHRLVVRVERRPEIPGYRLVFCPGCEAIW